MNAKDLIPGEIYRMMRTGELAEFSRISASGFAIFHPPGEPGMQSCWWVDAQRVERLATKDEAARCRGGCMY